MTDYDELDFEQNEQDKVVTQLIFDIDFLQKCLRKNLEPELFTGEIRVLVIEYIFEYYKKYKEAPKDSIIDIISKNSPISIKIREDDIPALIKYISKIIAIKNSPGKVKQLFDKLTNFIEKRIVFNHINKLNKLKDRLDGSPEKLKQIINETNKQLSVRSTMDKTSGIFDEDIYIPTNWLTRFNIPVLDKAYGGGLSAPNLLVLQAFTGRGKTWAICHLAKIGLRLGNDVISFQTEMNDKKFKMRMRTTLTGMNTHEYYNNMDVARKIIQKSMVGGAEMHFISEQTELDVDFYIDSIANIVTEKEDQTGKEQKLILIDSPDDMEPPKNDKWNNSIEKSKAIYTWLRNYCQKYDKVIVATSQSQRLSESLLWTTTGNIGDDIWKMRRSTLGISINALKKEVEAGYIRLLVCKNTYGPTMASCWIKTGLNRGQFIDEFGPIEGMSIKAYKQMLLNRGIKLSKSAKDE